MLRDEVISRLSRAMPDLRREFGLRCVYLFGSVARGEEGPLSDIDVLVEFEPTAKPTLLTLAGVYGRLGDLFGRCVDVGTVDSLRPALRATVHREMLRVA
ncbi:MAG TPA: nucleotidyltransferase family protein [Phycisphaerales bacterium]|nr:nucleotidyltransferase family protein [Phycisphaerales bacterium]